MNDSSKLNNKKCYRVFGKVARISNGARISMMSSKTDNKNDRAEFNKRYCKRVQDLREGAGVCQTVTYANWR